MIQQGESWWSASNGRRRHARDAGAGAGADEKAGGEILDTLNARDQFGFPTLLVDDFKLSSGGHGP